MSNNLFVGGFPYKTTEGELAGLFRACGRVLKVKILTERDTGRSRGLAFVEMGTPAEARTAIAKLNGARVGDRKIFVSEARPKDDRPAGAGAKPGFVERRSGKDRRQSPSKPPGERREERNPWGKKPNAGGFSGKKKWGAGGPGGGKRPGFKKTRFGRRFGGAPRSNS